MTVNDDSSDPPHGEDAPPPAPPRRVDVAVGSWSCQISNQHRKTYPGHRIRQRTVIHLRGVVHGDTASGETAGVYLTFERGAQALEPTISVGDDPAERVRVDVYLVHGQEAAALAILQSGFHTWARFSENALGQALFVLESGVEPRGVSRRAAEPGESAG